ncbi:MAG: glutathione S-transferase family protein [Phenylobacterium sp.]|uniref:glutathione S-transferase family protein n=1 Tax=Phenylobacterium sp. TaxID=1871053 RepID=UPI0025E535BF|nr:glutathione S-transferase family protein [Phenylobacterium sp.]MBA4011409.1 glutathione S-transferase family protein [Phenylobacterium sp.]
MALTIYGSPRSRTIRVLWMAAELGLEYEHVPLEAADPALKSPAFLKLNPAGAVPTIVDDGFALAESTALNLYLAKTYGCGGLYPPTAHAEAGVWRWSLWAQAHLEPWLQRDASTAELRAQAGESMAQLALASLQVLDAALTGREWLVGDDFTVADLNVAGVLSPSRTAELDLEPFGAVQRWRSACYQRPAALAARQGLTAARRS